MPFGRLCRQKANQGPECHAVRAEGTGGA